MGLDSNVKLIYPEYKGWSLRWMTVKVNMGPCEPEYGAAKVAAYFDKEERTGLPPVNHEEVGCPGEDPQRKLDTVIYQSENVTPVEGQSEFIREFAKTNPKVFRAEDFFRYVKKDAWDVENSKKITIVMKQIFTVDEDTSKIIRIEFR